MSLTGGSLVSVIVPLGDTRHCDQLADQLAGITGSESQIEIVVVADGITDVPTLVDSERVQRYELIETDRRVGPAQALLIGLQAARGDWIWFADADDRWSADIIDVLMAAQRRTGADIAVCRARRVEATGRTWLMEGVAESVLLTGSEIPEAVLSGCLRGYLWNKLFRRGVLATTLSHDLTCQGDFVYLMDTLACVHSIAMVADECYQYIEHDGSIMAVNARQQASIDNTRISHQHALAVIERVWGRPETRLRLFFDVWHWLVPSLTTPVHEGWTLPRIRAVRTDLLPALTWRHIVATAGYRLPLAMHAALLRLPSRAVIGWYRCGRALIDWSASKPFLHRRIT